MVNLARVGLFVVCAWFSMVPYAYAFAYLSEHGPANHARAVMVPWMFSKTYCRLLSSRFWWLTHSSWSTGAPHRGLPWL